jgi:hypothetical protein
MKKIIMLALACVMMLGAQAQIVSSRSVTVKKAESTTTNYLRFGAGFMNIHGEDAGDANSNIGYNVVWGIQKPITDFDLYWDLNLGLGSRGFKYSDYDESFIAHNVQFSPLNIGWKPEITSDIKFDAHIGVYGSFDYAGKYKEDGESISLGDFIDYLDYEDESYKRFDVGLNFGVGVWYDRFNIDLTYQTGFIGMVDGVKSHNILLRLGIAF